MPKVIITFFLLSLTLLGLAQNKKQINTKSLVANSQGFLVGFNTYSFHSTDLKKWMIDNNLLSNQGSVHTGLAAGFLLSDKRSNQYVLGFNFGGSSWINNDFLRSWFEFGFYTPIISKEKILVSAGGSFNIGWSDIVTDVARERRLPLELQGADITQEMLDSGGDFYFNQPFYSVAPGLIVVKPLWDKNYQKTFLFAKLNSHHLLLRKWRFGYDTGSAIDQENRVDLIYPQIPSNEKWFLSVNIGLFILLSRPNHTSWH